MSHYKNALAGKTKVESAVDMVALRKVLCGQDRLPRDLAGTFEWVALYSRWPRQNGSRFLGFFNLKVYPTPYWSGTERQTSNRKYARKSSQHRIMVLCDCGKEVPAGRLAQHVCRQK